MNEPIYSAITALLYRGKDCRYGHGGLRYRSTRNCIFCSRLAKGKPPVIGLRELSARKVAQRLKETTYIGVVCKTCGTRGKYTSSGGCVVCQQNRKRSDRSRSKERERSRRMTKRDRHIHYKKYKGTFIANAKRRKLSLLQRVPKWVDLAHLKAIAQFYKDCPTGYHVDHVIPLRGKTVSGLHVLSNLQYLTGKDNRAKGNQYDGA